MSESPSWRVAVGSTLRSTIGAMALGAALLSAPWPVSAADAPGVSATEILVGGTFPFSGPASSLGGTGKGLAAYIDAINDRGGINGRKIKFLTADDGYVPPKAVEMTRRMIESDEVAFLFGSLGTPAIAGTIKYVNDKKVPHLFVTTGASKFTNFKEYPYTTTGLVSYETEGALYARYMDRTLPNAKIGVLYQNDDLGKDYVAGFKTHFKGDFDKRVTALSYELADATIDSQIVSLKSAGAQAIMLAATPKFASQAIRKMAGMGWKPLVMLSFVSSSVGTVIVPAGADNAIGVVSGTLVKDPSEKAWDNDPGMKEYRSFFAKYMPGLDINNLNYQYGYNQGHILEQVLKQCGNDLSRENILRQARAIKALSLPTLLPGIVVNTGPNSSMAYTQLQLQRWNGTAWERFGEVHSLDSK